ncbi:50S ribosomal protein L10 [Mycoplasmoides gallisepticum]|uniref:50S ribosomal protein L10 n=1 Tax=Mycoplasmoides gallisepticum TaxID=2096 RepID=UPI001244ECAC|nr:50S ribosomal protein L10 [Mycoplasmoides gallisepticum]QEX47099.1 50S ribosomal protein L10 [Mycoplasmoides gallisepticum]WVH33894.1 50S ribosomal protein L10 [Mycoplasmoides gallisepticum]WVH34623.1 50S ribosomal protein L10 [Mycoplasmoides gallisepticum]WVH35362.1 50S ribosomal protein L10 [Mycoplasmoides gallisepticum]WVH36082.1 50S ribosomal protein L10 [Mycoplasmoides gallisepticum]
MNFKYTMKAIIQKKIEHVNKIAGLLKEAKSFVVFEYSTMTAKAITALRRKVKTSANQMFVLKNNILKRAINEAGIDGFDDDIKNQIAVVIGLEDAFLPIKAVHEYVTANEKVKYVCGYLENKKLSAAELSEIAVLPSRDELYSMFLSVLQAPVRKFMYALKAVADTKQQ